MTDPGATDPRVPGATETAEMIFERINRRRQARDQAAPPAREPVRMPSGPTERTGAQETAVPLRIEEVLVDGAVAASAQSALPRSSLPQSAIPPSALSGRSDGLEDDDFPRSATMRFILKHPALALGVGVPAAAVLLRSEGTRRIMRLALKLGTQPDLLTLVQLSAAAATARRAVPTPSGARATGDPTTPPLL